MKANELRIGNLVYETINRSNEKVVEISSLSDGHISWRPGRNTGHHAHIKPIPLIEDWLLKLGLKKVTDRVFMKGDFGVELGFFNFFLIKVDGHVLRIGNNEHVHQLQNLYFALTGEELTYNC